MQEPTSKTHTPRDTFLIQMHHGVAALPVDTEYTILFKNNNSRRCAVRVHIDGVRVSPFGDFVVDAGSELDLECFVSDLDKG